MLTRMLGLALTMGTALLGLVCAGIVGYAVAAGRRRLARRTALAATVWLALYALLVAVSPSLYPERLLAVGEERAFCGIDCHLKLAVVGVRADSSGAADSVDWRIRLRARSDARRAPEHPGALVLEVQDAAGRRWAAHPLAGAPRFTRSLAPGDTQVAEVTARIPRGGGTPRLVARRGGVVPHLVPLDGNARVQEKTRFALGGAS